MLLDEQKYPIGVFAKPAKITSDILDNNINDIATFPARIKAAVQQLTDEQLDTPYRQDGWTIRQVVHHCAELLIQANKLVGGRDAVLVIDDTAMPKKGKHSVGVAAQYASALGKTANCQTLVSLTLARGEVPVMVALRLFLPQSWTSDRVRLKRAGVPAEHRTARTKPEIALAEIDRMIAAGVRFGCVLADAGYGMSAPFRHALTERSLLWAPQKRGWLPPPLMSDPDLPIPMSERFYTLFLSSF